MKVYLGWSRLWTLNHVLTKYLGPALQSGGNFYTDVKSDFRFNTPSLKNKKVVDYRTNGSDYDFTAGVYEVSDMTNTEEENYFLNLCKKCKSEFNTFKNDSDKKKGDSRFLFNGMVNPWLAFRLFAFTYSGNYHKEKGLPVLAGELVGFKNLEKETMILTGDLRAEFYGQDYIDIEFGNWNSNDGKYNNPVVIDKDNKPISGSLVLLSSKTTADGSKKYPSLRKTYDLSKLSSKAQDREELKKLGFQNIQI